jgi:O-antigen/teichoic acid export membrane protein
MNNANTGNAQKEKTQPKKVSLAIFIAVVAFSSAILSFFDRYLPHWFWVWVFLGLAVLYFGAWAVAKAYLRRRKVD